MDHPFIHYYQTELRFIRELGAEFARRFPKVAGRLGLSELACDDPHVERLLQGFAYMAGGVHMALDAEFPALSQPLVEVLYRNILAPTPSMAVVQFKVAEQSSSLGEGYTVPRDTRLDVRTSQRSGDAGRCEFRTAHSVRLLPITIEDAAYTSVLRDLGELRVPARAPIRALLKLKLRCQNMSFDRLGLSTLPLFVRGRDECSARLHEQLLTHASTIIMRWGPDATRQVALATEPQPIQPHGFEPDQALLPRVPSAFEPFRLLHEYFACPARFDFVQLVGLSSGLSRCSQQQLELIIPLTCFDPSLEQAVDASRLVLFATPVVNLFPHDCGRVTLPAGKEWKLVPDPTRPLDFEVHSLSQVYAQNPDRTGSVELRPGYVIQPAHADTAQARYALRRQTNALPEHCGGARTGYLGSDVYLRLLEPREAPRSRQLSVRALCTNRNLPAALGTGAIGSAGGIGATGHDNPPAHSHFEVKSGIPAEAVNCIVAPTLPAAVHAEGATVWRFLSHLSRSAPYVHEQSGGVAAIHELLALYAPLAAPGLQRQMDGIHRTEAKPIIGPFPAPGQHSYVRGLEVRLECEEQAFGRHGAFTLAAVLARLFAKHVSTGSFAQTVLSTRERGAVYTFPALPGMRHVL